MRKNTMLVGMFAIFIAMAVPLIAVDTTGIFGEYGPENIPGEYGPPSEIPKPEIPTLPGGGNSSTNPQQNGGNSSTNPPQNWDPTQGGAPPEGWEPPKLNPNDSESIEDKNRPMPNGYGDLKPPEGWQPPEGFTMPAGFGGGIPEFIKNMGMPEMPDGFDPTTNMDIMTTMKSEGDIEQMIRKFAPPGSNDPEKLVAEFKNMNTGVFAFAEKCGDISKIESQITLPSFKEDQMNVAKISPEVIKDMMMQAANAAKAANAKGDPVFEMLIKSQSEIMDAAKMMLSASSMKEMAEAKAALKVKAEFGTVQLDNNVVKTLANAEGKSDANVAISLGKAKADAMTEKQKAVAGNKQAFELKASAGNTVVHDLKGEAKVSIDYIPQPGEDMSKKTMYYCDDKGKLEPRHTEFSENKIHFTTPTFSLYVLMDTIPEPANNDNTMLFIGIAAALAAVGAVAFVVIRRRSAV